MQMAGASNIEEEGGDLAKGTGHVVVAGGAGEHLLRVELTRKGAGKWMVSAVTEAPVASEPSPP